MLAVRFRRISKVWFTSFEAKLFCSACFTSTGSAKSCTSSGDARVIWSKLVTFAAVRSCSKESRLVRASKNVLAFCHCFKMRGVYAKRVATKMVNDFTRADRTIDRLPSPSMCADLAARITTAKVPVFASIANFGATYPVPAAASNRSGLWGRTIAVDLLPKPLFFALTTLHNNGI